MNGVPSTSSVPASPRELILVMICILSALAADASASDGFDRSDFPTGNNPFSIAAGDLNGDGKLDLVTANETSNTVSVLLGSGFGTVGPKTDYATGTGPVSVAIADFNCDGLLDLATANYGAHTTSVLLGIGGGLFGPRTNFATGLGPFSIAAGDLNRDGRPDLVVVNDFSGTFSVLLNSTAPGGAPPTFLPTSDFVTGSGPLWVAIGDLNRDGKPDVVTANQDGQSVSVHPNSGSLTPGGPAAFGPRTDYSIGGECYSVAIADLNSDGKLDLAASNQVLGRIAVMLGNGNGTFGPRTDYPAGILASTVAIGDLDADGKPDLIALNNDASTVTVRLGAGDGTFGPRADIDAGTEPVSIAIGDLDGEGRLDMAVANYTFPGMIAILLNTLSQETGPIAFGPGSDFATGSYPTSVAIGDLNRDGNPDLAAANSSAGNVSVRLGDGAGGFGASNDFSTGSLPYSVAIGDVNRDGRLDLATANHTSNTASVLLGDGAGGFGTKTDFATGSNPISVALGDLNCDGRLDLVTANENSNTVSVLMGDGGGGFGAGTDFATGSAPTMIAIADLTHDGNPDVTVANRNSNSVSVLLGDGTGGLGPRTDFATGFFPTSVAIGDLDRDGTLDLAVAARGADLVSVLRGDGTGDYGTRTDFAIGNGPFSITIGDVNSDGMPDIVTANELASTVSVRINTTTPGGGAFAFDPNVEFTTGPGPTSVAIEDLNHDGRLDVATSNFDASGTVSVLLNTMPLVSVPPGTPAVELALGAVAPNPSRGPVHIPFSLGTGSVVRLRVVDVMGRSVAALADRAFPPGQHEVIWNGMKEGRPAPAGIYFVRVQAGGQALQRRLVWLR